MISLDSRGHLSIAKWKSQWRGNGPCSGYVTSNLEPSLRFKMVNQNPLFLIVQNPSYSTPLPLDNPSAQPVGASCLQLATKG